MVWAAMLPESYHWANNISQAFSDADHAQGLTDVSAVGAAPDGTRMSIAATS